MSADLGHCGRCGCPFLPDQRVAFQAGPTVHPSRLYDDPDEHADPLDCVHGLLSNARSDDVRRPSEELQRERAEVVRLRDIITRAYAASDNDGGSASDAIQEMLWILDEADRDRTETGEADDGSLAHPDQGLDRDDDCWADYAMRMRAANERALEALRGGSSRSLYDAEVMLSDALAGEGPATEDERKFIERWIAALQARRVAIGGENPRRHEWSMSAAQALAGRTEEEPW